MLLRVPNPAIRTVTIQRDYKVVDGVVDVPDSVAPMLIAGGYLPLDGEAPETPDLDPGRRRRVGILHTIKI